MSERSANMGRLWVWVRQRSVTEPQRTTKESYRASRMPSKEPSYHEKRALIELKGALITREKGVDELKRALVAREKGVKRA